MKLSKVWSDVRRTIDLILHALDNNVTAQENLGPTGAPEGYSLQSVAPNKIPQWLPPTTIVAAPGSVVTPGPDGTTVVAGPAGPPGADGAPGADGDTLGHWEPLAFDGAVLFDSEGDVVVAWVNA